MVPCQGGGAPVVDSLTAGLSERTTGPMLVFALVSAGIGLALATLSLFLPHPPGPRANPPSGAETQASAEPQDLAENPRPAAGATERTPHPQGVVLRLVGMPLLAAGLAGTLLDLLGRPFTTNLAVSLALGLPVGFAAALILGRTLGSPKDSPKP